MTDSKSNKTSSGNVSIRKMSQASFCLETSVELPATRSQVFDFFSDAANLEKITPKFLNFRVLTPLPIEMKSGARIDYKIRLHGIPIRWRTNISAWEPDQRFVDEQIKGPYRKWHHEHIFEEAGDHTLMKDIVNYRVWLAPLLHPLVVKRDLLRIFAYRQQRILELFS